ncbi:E3 ubiquitin-protein ligase rnf146 isoform X2 [Drosophila willistoni]|uniref:E3 ubiquitin-protein ligase rnf146 isoform X2 n=1 Tax=Drosophila willistoni TaxID=7260 RepID=UPI000C26D644|nr:E3 ubiquitin-protein ligase rnf146 isoform X2 [Drosophila willistoni]
MSQQQQKRASASDAPHNEIINLDDDDEDGNGDGDEDDVQYLGTVYQQQHLNPVTVPVATVSTPTTDLYVSPSTSAQAQAASASCSSSTSTNATEETTAGDAGGASGCSNAVAPLECPICLQTCIHPARLPCGHIFCFLCVKGVAYKNRRCAMCRREIPAEFLDHPQLVNGIDDICATRATEDGYQWYYEGRNGWWQYDDRTSQDIEEAFKKGDKSCTILVAGYVYIVDLEQLLQQRQNEPQRCRRVKRDLATIPKKGVAGLRIEGNQVTSETVFSRQTTNSNSNNHHNPLTTAGNVINHQSLNTAVPIAIPATTSSSLAAAASSFISTIAATDAAMRIASDIIGSTLAHADELTRGLTSSNISDDPAATISASSSSPHSMQDLMYMVSTEDLLDTTQQVIATNQHTIDLFEQALNDFQALTMRQYVDSSDDDDDDDDDEDDDHLNNGVIGNGIQRNEDQRQQHRQNEGELGGEGEVEEDHIQPPHHTQNF